MGKGIDMKKLLLLTAVSALVLSAGNSFADSKPATATVQATIVGAGTITKSQDMNFGTIVSSTDAQVATLSPDGVLSDNVTVARGDTVKAAQFTVTGDTGMKYTLAVTSTDLTSGANKMSLSNPVILVNNETYVGSDNTLKAGGDTIKVGADLNIGANQASGKYSGTLTLTMSY